MKKSLTLSDTESKLQNNGYLRKNDTTYEKIVEKVLDYADENEKILFSNTFTFKFVAILDETGLIDSYCEPTHPFIVRTEHDKAALNEILDEFIEDFSGEYPDGMA